MSVVQFVQDKIANNFLGKKSSNNLQIMSLDGLRGVAVLLVVFSHLCNSKLTIMPGMNFGGSGAYGVYLFFVLSAFLLSLPWFSDNALEIKNPYVWANYGVRRIFRIMPLYYTVLIACYLITRYTQSDFVYNLSENELAGHMMLLRGKDVLWSIPVEFKFYLLLPILIILMVVVFRGSILKSAIFSVVAIILAKTFGQPFENHVRSLSLLTYFPTFMFGSLAALIHARLSASNMAENQNIKMAFEIIAVCCLVACIAMVPSFWSLLVESPVSIKHFHGNIVFFGLLWSLLIVSHLNGTGLIRNVFSFKPLRLVGICSFSLYLLHYPIIRLLSKNIVMESSIKSWIIIAVAMIISMLSYLFIEKPFLKVRFNIK